MIRVFVTVSCAYLDSSSSSASPVWNSAVILYIFYYHGLFRRQGRVFHRCGVFFSATRTVGISLQSSVRPALKSPWETLHLLRNFLVAGGRINRGTASRPSFPLQLSKQPDRILSRRSLRCRSLFGAILVPCSPFRGLSVSAVCSCGPFKLLCHCERTRR